MNSPGSTAPPFPVANSVHTVRPRMGVPDEIKSVLRLLPGQLPNNPLQKKGSVKEPVRQQPAALMNSNG